MEQEDGTIKDLSDETRFDPSSIIRTGLSAAVMKPAGDVWLEACMPLPSFCQQDYDNPELDDSKKLSPGKAL
jgi:hypothetical protein